MVNRKINLAGLPLVRVLVIRNARMERLFHVFSKTVLRHVPVFCTISIRQGVKAAAEALLRRDAADGGMIA